MSVTSDMEARLRPLMLKALDGDAAAYRALLEHLRRHLKLYYARRLNSRSPPMATTWCRKP